MGVYNERDVGQFAGVSQRAQLATCFRPDLTITTDDQIVWLIDTAEIGAVNACITIHNKGSTAVRLNAFVSNDKDRIASAAGRVALTELFSEADASLALPLTINGTTVDHAILGYKNQPMLTTFRYWGFYLDTASGSSTVDVYGNAK